MLYSVGPGRAPSSEVAHWSMLGYRPDEFPGRAVFEAVGRGQEVRAEHVFAYAALRPAELRDGELWLTGRPDPDARRGGGRSARRALRRDRGRRPAFSLAHVWRGEAVLRVVGRRRRPRVTDTDAFFRDRHPVLRPQAVVPEAERTARAAEEWTREVMRRLEGERFNVITLKWWGTTDAACRRSSSVTASRGTFVGESAFLRGLAPYVGLEPIEEPETDDPVDDMRRRLALVRERLDAGETSSSSTRRRPTRPATRRIRAVKRRRSSSSTRRWASCPSTARSSA